jgi:glucokinase
MPSRTLIGIDLGGTNLRAGLLGPEGARLAVRRVATDRAGGPEAVLGQIERLVAELRDAGTAAIGIGVPGIIDEEGTTVLGIPALPGWAGVRLGDLVRERTGLACMLANDAKAAALGEWQVGAGAGQSNFVYVTVGTGIGSAAVVDGRLLRGAGGLAGEIGHTRVTDSPEPCACGLTGCWQAVASGAALDRTARAEVRREPAGRIAQLAASVPATGLHVAQAAREGDARATHLLHRHGVLLGYGLANLQHVYAPDRIVVGGGLSALLEPMRDAMTKTVRERLLPGFRPAVFVAAALGDDAGMIGAASLATGL